MITISKRRPVYASEVDEMQLRCLVNIGAAGAVSSFKGRNVLSVVHTSTGVYTVTLRGAVFEILSVGPEIVAAAAGTASAIAGCQLAAVGTSSFVVMTVNASGVLTDPASGEALMMAMEVKLSSVV